MKADKWVRDALGRGVNVRGGGEEAGEEGGVNGERKGGRRGGQGGRGGKGGRGEERGREGGRRRGKERGEGSYGRRQACHRESARVPVPTRLG